MLQPNNILNEISKSQTVAEKIAHLWRNKSEQAKKRVQLSSCLAHTKKNTTDNHWERVLNDCC